MINLAILSSTILLEDGTFHRAEITLTQAKTLINAFDTTNYTQHYSCALLGVEPAKERVTCESYDVAIVVKPNIRLEYGREYSVEEIEEIGYKIVVIWKSKFELMTEDELAKILFLPLTGQNGGTLAVKVKRVISLSCLYSLIQLAKHQNDFVIASYDSRYDSIEANDDEEEGDFFESYEKASDNCDEPYSFPLRFVDYLHIDNSSAAFWRAYDEN